MGAFAPAMACCKEKMKRDRSFEFPVAVAACEGLHADVESTHSSKLFVAIITISNPAWILGQRGKKSSYATGRSYDQMEAG